MRPRKSLEESLALVEDTQHVYRSVDSSIALCVDVSYTYLRRVCPE